MSDFEEVRQNKRSYAFLLGDALEVLRTLPDNTIDCVITSPPYWKLREYDTHNNPKEIGNEPDYQLYVRKMTEIFS